MLGNILIPGLGGYATYLLVTHLEQFNTPSSVDYIAQPEIIAAVGAAICLGVSLSFMSIFDTVSDAMLFAFMTDEEWRKDHRMPSNPNIPAKPGERIQFGSNSLRDAKELAGTSR